MPDPQQNLHLLLDTPGGDGETAIRVVRSAQARCRELTVIVPNQAKSAGTQTVTRCKSPSSPTSRL
jgi:membrane-bound ClpP family serine protease